MWCDAEGTRWKGENAAKAAIAEPVSALYNKLMQEWDQPMEALLFQTGAILHVASLEQSHVLERACFGVPLFPTTSDAIPLGDSEGLPGSIGTSTFLERKSSEVQLFQLMLEEAFYLSYHMRCIQICRQSTKGREYMTHEQFWEFLLKSKRRFPQHYKAYSHMRSNNWVVRAGIQYGADFMAYRHHPALVHSDYAVLVMAEEEEKPRMNTWTEVHAMNRLCGSVAKTLLLLHIVTNQQPMDTTSPTCLENYCVQAVEYQRWLPEKHREENLTTKEHYPGSEVSSDIDKQESTASTDEICE
ncbi:hypothetical protein O6H91_14G004500 [Diphasiastrum complanatum]|uniref:Uncharacterized protein n=1 Tax=Diphasiastrum complanatum TaxID=34168 RepID=A0ACC2BL98_DIPCM|nr:hypothetical protein O6H91_14G004500 [Diphasiastrum complanatum]